MPLPFYAALTFIFFSISLFSNSSEIDIRGDLVRLGKAQSSTYVRCWYREKPSHDEAKANWVWAKNEDGSYFSITGYWYSRITPGNMFYTTTPQQTIYKQCQTTLADMNDDKDISFYAANSLYSINYTIWSNDTTYDPAKPGINRIVSFGNSLSDTGNLFNLTKFSIPNIASWFAGRFSNGFVWTEYLAKKINLPLYTWSVGGAAGEDHLEIIQGVKHQIDSFNTYKTSAEHYLPEQTLFTLEFGANDLLIYNTPLENMLSNIDDVFIRLAESGAKNVLLVLLPDVSRIPMAGIFTPSQRETMSKQVVILNNHLKSTADKYSKAGINIVTFDTFQYFQQLVNQPQDFGLKNTTSACLDVGQMVGSIFLFAQQLTPQCAQLSSDSYLFWDSMHPTTKVHELVAEEISTLILESFEINTNE